MGKSTTLTFYGGVGEIGGNMIHLQFGEYGMFLDFGINFKRSSMFFDEFLKPRSNRGVSDFLALGMVPKIRNYRPDLVPADVDITSFPKLKLDYVFVSHAHMDHAGNIGLLPMGIPVVASPVTATILKAIKDTGTQMESEVAYSAERKPKDDPRTIEPGNWKNTPFTGRKFIIAGKIDSELETFCSTCPGSRELVPGGLAEAQGELPFKGHAFEVDHSIYGATAYAIETPAGWVVYTGDLRLHGAKGASTAAFVKAAAGLEPAVLIIEGTRIDGTERSVTEEAVYKTCRDAVLSEKNGLVIADFSARNFERLDTFIRIAKESDRELVVMYKDAYLLEAIKFADNIDRMKDLRIFNVLKSRTKGFEDSVMDKFEDQLVDLEEIKENPKGFILCFSFFDMKHLLDIMPDGGTYVYSSSEAYTEEQAIDFLKLWNWLKVFNFKAKGFRVVGSGDDARPEFDRGYHASGHASSEELIKIIEDIAPKKVIPVHTDHPEMFEDLVSAKVEKKLEKGRDYPI